MKISLIFSDVGVNGVDAQSTQLKVESRQDEAASASRAACRVRTRRYRRVLP
jgi:hypothetical protein